MESFLFLQPSNQRSKQPTNQPSNHLCIHALYLPNLWVKMKFFFFKLICQVFCHNLMTCNLNFSKYSYEDRGLRTHSLCECQRKYIKSCFFFQWVLRLKFKSSICSMFLYPQSKLSNIMVPILSTNSKNYFKENL